ncbi:MAG: hypothetical protein IPI88_07270 [Chitinophagaceae bacterium]|nr:hypothetical protein [Chitinophagaceae bacterium]
MKKEIRIENLPIVEEFTKHFSMEENKRILFSAPFGTGKSTFLQEYFSNQDVKCIHLTLYPINYAVAANEDVFELIKYDLLLELLVRYGDDIELSKEEFGILFSGQYFIYDQLKLRGIISKIISLGDKLGKPVFQLLKNFDETVTDIESFKNKMEKDEKAFLQEYLKSMERKAGSITEMDDISLLIFNLIERLIKKKSTENEKFYSVLIIDDLDRMDPDHIFRLFNIFSSHYDVVSNKNKFGFNKVILFATLKT